MMHYICRICIIYSLVTAICSKEKIDCPCDHRNFCNCSMMNLDTIPSRLPKGMEGLNVSDNRIQIVTGIDLKPFKKLKILLLQYNQIHTISDDSFQSLINLEDLDLSHNDLTVLSSAWFTNLHMLQHLDLLGNHYTSLGKSALFSSLSSLKSLKFGNPSFLAIEKYNFEGLGIIDELNINCSNLKQYTAESLKVIKDIDHIILTVNISLLAVMIKDLVSSVRWLEVTNASFINPEDVMAFAVLNNTSVKKLMFKNCVITDNSLARLIEIMDTYRNVTEVVLEDSELLGTGQGYPRLKEELRSIRTIIIKNLHIPNFYLFSDLRFAYKLAHKITSVTCTDSKVFLVPCEFSRSFLSLQYLDLSANLLANIFLANSACFREGGGAWPLLQTLNVSKNVLSDLPVVGKILSSQLHLTNLDISQNNFAESSNSPCEWPPKLKYLNISSCQITKITTCIPDYLEILDVSNNFLTVFAVDQPLLKELYISNNRLTKLAENAHLPNLVALIISKNKINDFTKTDLEPFPKLTTLDASDNNYVCSCQFLDFIQYQTNMLLGWPDNYKCDSPSSVRQKLIQFARLPLLMCHQTLIVTLACITLILVVGITVALCHFLHVIWYVKMTWAWLQAKRKPLKVSERDICYDAFISYSERDSEWVENMMVQELENTNPPLKLCLHKRDFIPGKWIIDNIIDAMENSYKTVFVLSEHFVQSEWCRYELEFSHFRLFDENNDTAILVLLEPIDKETVPKRFCKLRKLMNTKTYMEWPTEEEKQHIFWFNLKLALQTKDYVDVCAT
ncbi:toll-like receptor 2 type-2 [Ascaphus truei]|uniref:toll-like receptor 2 type-2 n=1 Tax=Ascaphus truei TaxID=8439 RepID=UPI003F598FF3